MGREMKFRAWDTKRKEWYGESNPNILIFKDFHIFGECTLLCTPACEDLQHLEITQYTGLKDKGGKNIYEGDIVLVKEVRICEVIFHEYAGCWDLVLRNAISSESIGSVSPASYQYHTEVIGNIYENPELLSNDLQTNAS